MIKVFISYAREDESFKDELNKWLKPLERDNVIKIWDDRQIIPGQNWNDTIKDALQWSEVMLFLISSSFIYSDYIHHTEIKNAVERHKNKEVLIIPIIIRPADFSSLEMSKFQALPRDGKPISTWSDRDSAWLDVTKQLRNLFESINSGQIKLKKPDSNSTSSSPTPQNNISPNPPKTNATAINDIKLLVADDKLEKALNALLELSKSDSDLNNQAILLMARYKGLKRNLNQGVISDNEASINKARIINSILSFLEEF